MMRKTILLFVLLAANLLLAAQTSVAGLYPLAGSGRVIYDFNNGWRFYRGDAKNAESIGYDDKAWAVVSTPHTVQLMPSEGSGCRNYQGIAWYRKHFVLPRDMADKQALVYFEAIMGKQKVYVNGKLVKEHLGGYLPITVDLTAQGVKPGDKCLIAVMADNSDDGSYPPGKKQTALDFCYHGGIYRDVWLIGKSSVSISDAIEAGKVAGGGVFVHYGEISDKRAEIFVNVDVANANAKTSVEALIRDADGKMVKKLVGRSLLHTTITHPHLWSPENPYLYRVELRVKDGRNVVDGGMVRIGIRNAEFRGKDGFWLNGKPYHQLIGGNRHQDFAYVGNAVPNSQQWRDAKRLKDAGMMIVRAAHYPQDPSFMDACDELGLFVIVPTPGWQYWGKDVQFAERVYQNTRDIIRRDRNHACVLMWEPILNETRFPEDFSLKSLQITKDEYPYPHRPVAAADLNSAGVKEHYDVVYGWPETVSGADAPRQCVFTREFGEYVDDWYAHNAINRCSRSWGEKPQLTQALSLADTYGLMFHGQRQFIGGCQWHPFDHQRGYHPDPYFGGIYDAFRQKKYAYELFRSQIAGDSAMVFIANELTQFSDSDVVIFSNCDSVRLTAFDGDKVLTLPVVHRQNEIPDAPVVFRGFWNFWKARDYSYTKRNWQKVSLLAEGIRDGKVVCREKKMPSRRSTRLRLYADFMGKQLTADGSDFIVVVAEVTDDSGNVRRLAKDEVLFTVEGEGKIIGDASILANPRQVEWGSAPVLVQSTLKTGNLKITAQPLFGGAYAPAPASMVLQSKPAEYPACYDKTELVTVESSTSSLPAQKASLTDKDKQRILNEVEQQQKDFGIQ